MDERILKPQLFSGLLREQFESEAEEFDSFEELADTWHGVFRQARGMAQYKERRLRETRERTARRQIGHLGAATAVRIVDLSSALITLVNSNHPHGAYTVARAVVETAAVPAYMDKNLSPLIARRRADRADDLLRRLTLGVDPGTGYDRGGGPIQPIRVSSLIKALCSAMDESMPDRDGEIRRDDDGPALLDAVGSHPSQPLSSSSVRDDRCGRNAVEPRRRLGGRSVARRHRYECARVVVRAPCAEVCAPERKSAPASARG